jgi:hypothetical protein
MIGEFSIFADERATRAGVPKMHQLTLEQLLLRSKDGNRKRSCGHSDVGLPVSFRVNSKHSRVRTAFFGAMIGIILNGLI